jgi:hypothetical protein
MRIPKTHAPAAPRTASRHSSTTASADDTPNAGLLLRLDQEDAAVSILSSLVVDSEDSQDPLLAAMRDRARELLAELR